MCFIGLRLRLRFAEQELGSSDLYIVHASACWRKLYAQLGLRGPIE
ncbi:hypothetical protein LNTAR_10986 [Lentisphaera araneosa HTCC2155]|uniref:Uncharacterized protein n=1 Tax=Lentisphaera araneosa HTCC2155 TaxID=313628 RepID=A6DJ00_9BACT|nr:hypothetical protein LNTAR_10986 [Lentisphaera araneosa HTCC2155]